MTSDRVSRRKRQRVRAKRRRGAEAPTAGAQQMGPGSRERAKATLRKKLLETIVLSPLDQHPCRYFRILR
ncbi:hypothetical protein GCM10022248_93280 [Nonomuraea soli]